jgi:hypothetical protein
MAACEAASAALQRNIALSPVRSLALRFPD